ncbi:hypothetical protein H072_710 [Dactylellina haptotyla CBS 200.50]|uniref:Peptide hydrolase n=1 Tax=Dactylellina haptotyla (strain CBS 200.50) TaxID=1284197 RepID=S8AR00_DACHA|nr:hypothetical protein H072_710 [Dactylellina haptotyla CBS 200.50]
MRVSTLTLTTTLLAVASALPASVELVDSTKLQPFITKEKLEAKVQELYAIAKRNNGTRDLGSSGAADTLDWIENNLPKDYYNIERQSFDVERLVYDEVSITVDGVSQEEVAKMFYNGNGKVSAPVVLAKNHGCNATDFPSDTAGKITIVRRGGECRFGESMSRAGKLGAAGFILWDNMPTLQKDTEGEYHTGWVAPASDYNITEYPVSVLVGHSVVQAMVDNYQLEKGASRVNVTIACRWHNEVQKGYNIIATTKGGDQNAIITVGAHTDSVEAGPGINDNGSGTIAQIEVANALSKFSVKNAVRFCFWSGEELGLLGSQHYTAHLSDAEAAKIVMNLDFDMLASPNYIYSVYASGSNFKFKTPQSRAGSDMIAGVFKDFFKESGDIPNLPTEFDGRSDYAGFLDRGIPASGVYTGAEKIKTEEEARLFGGEAGKPYDPCYHQACDDDTNINYEAFVVGVKSVAFSVGKFGGSTEGFPFPRPTNATLPATRRLSKRESSAPLILVD